MQFHPLAKGAVALTAAFLLAGASAWAQTASVFASGLTNPSKIILGPGGTLLVAEVGSTANSGRVSIVNSAGVRRTLIDGLPSGLSAPNQDPDGPNGLLLDGNSLYVAIGEGDQLANGQTQGTTVPNPKGPSSPILDSVLRFDLSQSVDAIQNAFTLKTADQSTLADGNTATLDNGGGDKATVTVLSAFRYRADPVAIYRNSHPYGLAKLDKDPAHLYMVDAGLNALVQIDSQSGRARTIAHFDNVPNQSGFGPPVSEAVPDSVRPYGDQLLVTLLTGFPFVPGNSKVVVVDPVTGKIDPFINLLSSTIDIVYRDRPSGRSQFFVLQYSANQLANAPGKLLVFNSPSAEVALDGLKGPSSLAIDATGGKLYVASRTDGTIQQLDIGK